MHLTVESAEGFFFEFSEKIGKSIFVVEIFWHLNRLLVKN